MKHKERGLFFTLWGLITFAAALWYFRPQTNRAVVELPQLTLRQELSTWFTEGKIVQSSGSRYQIALSVRPDYARSLATGDKHILLGYQFSRGNSLLADRHATFPIRPNQSVVSVTLENPEHVSPSEITLYLAH